MTERSNKKKYPLCAAALALAAVAGLFAHSGDSLGWVYAVLALLAFYNEFDKVPLEERK